jgi:hypothetical protein
MKQTVSILSSTEKEKALKKIMVVFCIPIFLSTSSAWIPLPDSSTYFPLVPGSYWIYQDSVYNPADAEDIGTSTLTKDSIISRTVCDSGIIVTWVNITTADGKRDSPFKCQYFCDTNGYVFERVIKKNKLEKWGQPCYKINPRLGDTCVLENDTIVYKKNTSYGWVYSESINKRHPEYDITNYFAKGIGFIGSPGIGFSHNLIEYRIGSGPIIKKHWLMEAPKQK